MSNEENTPIAINRVHSETRMKGHGKTIPTQNHIHMVRTKRLLCRETLTTGSKKGDQKGIHYSQRN